jgi:hypothetical protein
VVVLFLLASGLYNSLACAGPAFHISPEGDDEKGTGTHYNHPLRQATDGSYETFCELKQNNNGDTLWLRVDLTRKYVIQKVALSPPLLKDEPETRANIEIQASNDESFDTFTVLWQQNGVPYKYKGLNYPKEPPLKLWRHNSNTMIKYVNDPQSYRFISVAKKKGDVFNLSELEIFGVPACEK